MTPESFAALGARLLLVDRFRLPLTVVAAMSDENAVTVAPTALAAADGVTDYLTGRTR